MNSPTLFLLVNGISPEGKEYNLLHCNWGWDGRHNGYYLSKVFNTNNPANLPSTISPPPVRSNVPYYFQYNLQYSIIYTTK